MTRITPDLLNDTLNLIQLARETALARGKQEQAERLSPVVNNLRNLVGAARQQPAQPPISNANPDQAQNSAASLVNGLMAQSDFQTLLNAVQSKPASVSPNTSPAERYQVISSMSAAGMPDVDIARHMGLTRDDVRMILNLGGAAQSDRRSFSQVQK
jgi:hypothetical protein